MWILDLVSVNVCLQIMDQAWLTCRWLLGHGGGMHSTEWHSGLDIKLSLLVYEVLVKSFSPSTRQELGNSVDAWKLVESESVKSLMGDFTCAILSCLSLFFFLMNSGNMMLWLMFFFNQYAYLLVFWSSRAPNSLNHKSWRLLKGTPAKKRTKIWLTRTQTSRSTRHWERSLDTLRRRQAASCYFSIQEALHGNLPNLIWGH